MGRRGAVLAALGAGVLALSGCGATGGATGGGDAALADTFQITQADVSDEVAAVMDALGEPPAEPPAGLALATVQRLVRDEVVSGKAVEMQVRVSERQVRDALDAFAAEYGGIESLRNAALQSGISPTALEGFVRTNVLVTAIGSVLAPGEDADGQLAVASDALAQYSAAVDVQVAPRYGTWEDTTLSITPGSTVAQDAPELVAP